VHAFESILQFQHPIRRFPSVQCLPETKLVTSSVLTVHCLLRLREQTAVSTSGSAILNGVRSVCLKKTASDWIYINLYFTNNMVANNQKYSVTTTELNKKSNIKKKKKNTHTDIKKPVASYVQVSIVAHSY
jgi:hypothetical protein